MKIMGAYRYKLKNRHKPQPPLGLRLNAVNAEINPDYFTSTSAPASSS